MIITTINAKNGSANNTGSSSLSGIFNDSDCTIISQTSGSATGPNVEFFGINPLFTSGLTSATWQLKNLFVDELPVETYYLTIQVQDAGGGSFADTVDIIINMGVTVTEVYQKVTITYSDSGLPGPDQYPPNGAPGYNELWYNTNLGSFCFQFQTYFYVNSGPTESQGWYIFNGPFSNSSYHYFFTYFGGVPDSPVQYQNSWEPNGYMTSTLADENNVIQIDFAESNTTIDQLKRGGTETAVFNEWFNGSAGSSSCRYSQNWAFASGSAYFADAVPAGCGETGNTIPLYCVPGMEDGTWTGKALDITANAALFGLDQYTFAVVT